MTLPDPQKTFPPVGKCTPPPAQKTPDPQKTKTPLGKWTPPPPTSLLNWTPLPAQMTPPDPQKTFPPVRMWTPLPAQATPPDPQKTFPPVGMWTPPPAQKTPPNPQKTFPPVGKWTPPPDQKTQDMKFGSGTVRMDAGRVPVGKNAVQFWCKMEDIFCVVMWNVCVCLSVEVNISQ